MARFTSEQMAYLVAYQNLYGLITPARLDVIAGRLGMDVAAPHMRRGRRPQLQDHVMVWSRSARPPLSGREMLAKVKALQAAYDEDDDRRTLRIRQTRREVAHGRTR
ncbi:hypothetical protein BJP40_19805 [Streptomyces sp. CC53]|uniref:hypothetical protein n=1 Tax=Streptomyces sp. CC53 TaxID=1906740 RepID=UPI0008DCA729|nr:hypothetical protein [Streptomyces sp. CC53]OII64587.1 hypothetical protein BJP40_19805 [Streptomyces sp. CC53]